MQEYVEERTVAISVKAGKLSGRALAAACKKVLAEMKKHHEAAKRLTLKCSSKTAPRQAERKEADEPLRHQKRHDAGGSPQGL